MNRLIAQVWNGVGAVSVIGSSPSLNVWTHSSTHGIILCVNGIEVATTVNTNHAAGDTSDYIFIGYYSTSGSINPEPFNGVVDEWRIYSRKLTLCDVWVLVNS
jgi:ABC-type Fe2+-enterobactin transport system substrate-binding protein